MKSINQNMPATSRRVVPIRRTEHFSRNAPHRRRLGSYTSHGTAHGSEERHMRRDTINLPASLCLPAVSTRSVDPQCRNSTQCRAGNASWTHADPPPCSDLELARKERTNTRLIGAKRAHWSNFPKNSNELVQQELGDGPTISPQKRLNKPELGA